LLVKKIRKKYAKKIKDLAEKYKYKYGWKNLFFILYIE
jgi:hypothetical protein